MVKEIGSREPFFGLIPRQIFTLTGFCGTGTKLCRNNNYFLFSSSACNLSVSKLYISTFGCYRFYVDRTPIRVFKNKQSIGVAYPSRPLQIEASLWDGDSWATDGGQTKTNWSNAPFKAYFKGFHISGCGVQNPADIKRCDASSLWWNKEKYWNLDSSERSAYETVRKKYMNYDYCADRHRYPTTPPECSQQY